MSNIYIMWNTCHPNPVLDLISPKSVPGQALDQTETQGPQWLPPLRDRHCWAAIVHLSSDSLVLNRWSASELMCFRPRLIPLIWISLFMTNWNYNGIIITIKKKKLLLSYYTESNCCFHFQPFSCVFVLFFSNYCEYIPPVILCHLLSFHKGSGYPSVCYNETLD